MNIIVDGDRGAFSRFIAKYTLARILVFAVPLLAALIAFQQLISLVAHQMPRPLRPLWFLPAELLYSALMLWLYCWAVRHFERRDVAELARHGAGRHVAAGVALGAALFSAVFTLLALGGYVQHAGFGSFAGLPAQAATAIAAAAGEELIFRGSIFRIAEERLGTAAALIVSAAIFGLMHGINPGATLTSTAAIALEAGVLLGMAYAASRSLWLPMGLHFGWNFTEGGIFGAAVSGGQGHGLMDSALAGPALMTGGAFGPEASVIAVAVSLAATAAIGLWAVRNGRWQPWSARRRPYRRVGNDSPL